MLHLLLWAGAATLFKLRVAGFSCRKSHVERSLGCPSTWEG